MNIQFTLNGVRKDLEVDPDRSVADILRQDLHLTGTKIGCDTQDCGVCSILLDDRLVKACGLTARHLDGHGVLTIEGVGGPDGGVSDLQVAFLDEGAVQCGFCIPAMVLAGEALLRRNPVPSRDDIRRGLATVLCRCTGYQQIVDAVAITARARQAARTPEDVR
ncbi:MAG TPA: (2Fe-2S)-binding protein [Anaerolineales bacterium]|nr:(2Fe-2S)-binding protein [Anaerolineales bacterium]